MSKEIKLNIKESTKSKENISQNLCFLNKKKANNPKTEIPIKPTLINGLDSVRPKEKKHQKTTNSLL
ncbi:MAG: hypothetical protein Q8K70_03505 [Bacteroidota bacterium]|nr:hypothetical protein [Bacteroidota bacterium]